MKNYELRIACFVRTQTYWQTTVAIFNSSFFIFNYHHSHASDAAQSLFAHALLNGVGVVAGSGEALAGGVEQRQVVVCVAPREPSSAVIGEHTLDGVAGDKGAVAVLRDEEPEVLVGVVVVGAHHQLHIVVADGVGDRHGVGQHRVLMPARRGQVVLLHIRGTGAAGEQQEDQKDYMTSPNPYRTSPNPSFRGGA